MAPASRNILSDHSSMEYAKITIVLAKQDRFVLRLRSVCFAVGFARSTGPRSGDGHRGAAGCFADIGMMSLLGHSVKEG